MTTLAQMLAAGGLSAQRHESAVAVAYNALSSSFQRSAPMANPEVVGRYLSAEAYGDDVRVALGGALSNLENTVRAMLKSSKIPTKTEPSATGSGKYAYESEEIMVQSACFGALAASDPRTALSRAPNTIEQLRAFSTQQPGINAAVIGNDPSVTTVERRISAETYDDRNNSNVMATTAAYNLAAPRQNAFGEMFFPTVVLTHDQVGASVEMKVHLLFKEAQHAVNGSAIDLKRVNILKSIVNPRLIDNSQTRLIPIVRGGGGATDSTAMFVASTDVAPRTILQDGQPIVTAPLKMGTTINLLGVSQRDALIARGQLDNTDRIDGAVSLENIYIKLGANGGAKTFKLTVIDQPFADFNQVQQGNTMTMQLNFNTKSLKVTDQTKDVTDATITGLAGLAGLTARLSVSIFGNLTLDTGATILNAGAVEVDRITNAAGELLDLSTGAGATAKALFTGAVVSGYDLKSYLTNSNLRQKGILIDQQTYVSMYTVPLLAPITSLRPIGAANTDDASRVETLVNVTHILTSNSAVAALLAWEANLAQWVGQADNSAYVPEILGPARYSIKPTLLQDTVDLTLSASLNESDKIADMISRVTNKLKDMALIMYVQSMYGVVDQAYSGVAEKPLVLIGCDPRIARFLTITGETRLLGDMFDVRIEASWNEDMAGKLFMSFGKAAAIGSGVPHPLHTGCMFWRPELTVSAPIYSNGQTSQQLMVNPSFRHVPLLPVLASLTVTGLSEAITQKLAINMHTV